MFIHHDPDEYETILEQSTCSFHQMYPIKPYTGCTCSYSVYQRWRSAEEIAAIKAEREREEEDRILALAELIKARRERS